MTNTHRGAGVFRNAPRFRDQQARTTTGNARPYLPPSIGSDIRTNVPGMMSKSARFDRPRTPVSHNANAEYVARGFADERRGGATAAFKQTAPRFRDPAAKSIPSEATTPVRGMAYDLSKKKSELSYGFKTGARFQRSFSSSTQNVEMYLPKGLSESKSGAYLHWTGPRFSGRRHSAAEHVDPYPLKGMADDVAKQASGRFHHGPRFTPERKKWYDVDPYLPPGMGAVPKEHERSAQPTRSHSVATTPGSAFYAKDEGWSRGGSRSVSPGAGQSLTPPTHGLTISKACAIPPPPVKTTARGDAHQGGKVAVA